MPSKTSLTSKTVKMKNNDKHQFPIIISDQSEKLENIKNEFIRIVGKSAKSIIEVYNELSLNKPFTTDLWKSLIVHGTSVLESLLKEKNEDIAKGLGMSLSDAVRLKLVNSRVSELSKIQMILWSIVESFYKPMHIEINQHLRPQDLTILDNGGFGIDENIMQSISRKMQLTISNQDELDTFNAIKQFREQYNTFIDFLDAKGFLPYVDNLTNSYLGNFFDVTDDLRLKERTDAVAFIFPKQP